MTAFPPAGPSRPGPDVPGPPTGAPGASPLVRPGGIAAVAAAATPVVAAALLAVAMIATGCRSRPAPPLVAPATPPAPVASADPTAPPNGTAPPGGSASRLLLVVGGPARPRAAVHDTGHPDDPAVPLQLPGTIADGGLVAVTAAPDGRLAMIGPDGSAWTALVPAPGDAATPHWIELPAAPTGPPSPEPVLGATWSIDGSAIVLLAGAPGSGSRRTTILTRPADGAAATSVEVPLEVDGPSVAALPGGVVAFVGRGLDDRGVLARVTGAGSFATLPITARTVTAGGGLVALADDTAVSLGSLADLERGILPTTPLPLDQDGGIGAVAIAPDGTGVAVVRLDGEGAATRVDVLRRVADGWALDATIPLDAADGTAIPAWLP